MTGTRRRFFRPGHAGFQPRDAALKLVFVVVENPGGWWLHAFAAVARLGVDRGTHGVANVVIQLRQPVAKLPVVEHTRFFIQKLADAMMQFKRN